MTGLEKDLFYICTRENTSQCYRVRRDPYKIILLLQYQTRDDNGIDGTKIRKPDGFVFFSIVDRHLLIDGAVGSVTANYTDCTNGRSENKHENYCIV